MATESAGITAERLLAAIKRCGIEYVIWLPDSETRFMYDALQADPALTLIPVCRESEAFGISAGLYLGGRTSVILIQNTGLFNSGDALRGELFSPKRPQLVVVGYRGWKRDGDVTDSAAFFTERFLSAFNLKHHLVTSDEEVGVISDAYAQAVAEREPVVILIGVEYERA